MHLRLETHPIGRAAERHLGHGKAGLAAGRRTHQARLECAETFVAGLAGMRSRKRQKSAKQCQRASRTPTILTWILGTGVPVTADRRPEAPAVQRPPQGERE